MSLRRPSCYWLSCLPRETSEPQECSEVFRALILVYRTKLRAMLLAVSSAERNIRAPGMLRGIQGFDSCSPNETSEPQDLRTLLWYSGLRHYGLSHNHFYSPILYHITRPSTNSNIGSCIPGAWYVVLYPVSSSRELLYARSQWYSSTAFIDDAYRYIAPVIRSQTIEGCSAYEYCNNSSKLLLSCVVSRVYRFLYNNPRNLDRHLWRTHGLLTGRGAG